MTLPELDTTEKFGSRYITLTNRRVVRIVSLSDSVMVELDEDGNAVGVEIL